MIEKMLKNNKGFSIVEILVVSGLSVMLMLTISSLFMTFLVGNTTANMRKSLNSEGNYALNQMTFLIRNSVEIKDCATPGEIQIRSLDNLDTTLMLDSSTDKIASSSPGKHPGGALFLTSAEVEASNLSFSCTDAGSVQYIDFNFTLSHKGAPTSVNDTFVSQVLLRN